MDAIVLDLPPPISVNLTRRFDFRTSAKVAAWYEMADRFILAAKARGDVVFHRIPKYELHIVLSEDHVRVDADNGLKLIIDYLHRREITADDGKKQLRKLTVEWGHAPAGVRLTVRPLQ